MSAGTDGKLTYASAGVDIEAGNEAVRRIKALVETTRRPDTFSRALMNKETSGGELNLAPSVSPDGKRLVFISERSRFSLAP